MFKEAREIIIDKIKNEEGLVAKVCRDALQNTTMPSELMEDFDNMFAREHKNFNDKTKHTLNHYRSNIRCNSCYYDAVSELLSELLYRKQLIGWFSDELIRCIVYDAPLGMFIDDQYLISDMEVEADTILDLHIRLLKVINNSAKRYFKENPPEEQIKGVEREIYNLTTINRRNNTKIYTEVRKSIVALLSDKTDITCIICGYELSKSNQNTMLGGTNINRLISEVNESSFNKSVKEHRLLLEYIDARRHGTSTLIVVSKLADVKISILYEVSKFVHTIIRSSVNMNDHMLTNERMHNLVQIA